MVVFVFIQDCKINIVSSYIASNYINPVFI